MELILKGLFNLCFRIVFLFSDGTAVDVGERQIADVQCILIKKI